MTSFLSVVFCAFVSASLVQCGHPIWRRLHDGTGNGVPQLRCEPGIGFDPSSNAVVMFGGRSCDNTDTIYGDTWWFDVASKAWQKLPNLSPSPPARYSLVFGSSNGYFYVSTGEGVDKKFYDDIWRFKFSTKKWEELPSQSRPPYLSEPSWHAGDVHRRLYKPDPRYGSAGGIYPGSHDFYISLGFSKSRFSDTWRYDTKSMGWFFVDGHSHPYSPAYPHARCLHSGTMIGPDELVIYGGCLSGGGTAGPCPSGDSWLFTTKDKKWTKYEDCATGRIKSSMAMLPVSEDQRAVVLFGGIEKNSQVLMSTESKNDEIAVLNPDEIWRPPVTIDTRRGKWANRKIDDAILHPGKRHSVAMATGHNGVFMFGGYSLKSDRAQNDMWLLDANATNIEKALYGSGCKLPHFTYITLHGILMGLAWGLFLPWGVFIARYMRHRDPLWFHMHRVFQVFGMLVAIGGFVCAIMSVRFDHFQFAHGILGLVVMVLGLQQPFNGIFRPKRSEKGSLKSRARTLWEQWHKCTGRVAILGGLANVSLGVFLGLASIYIWGAWFGYLCALLLAFFIGEMLKQARHRNEKRYVVKKGKKGHNENVFVNAAMDTESKP